MRGVEPPSLGYKARVIAIILHLHYFQKKPITFAIIKTIIKPKKRIAGKHSIVDLQGFEPWLHGCKPSVLPLTLKARISTSVESVKTH